MTFALLDSPVLSVLIFVGATAGSCYAVFQLLVLAIASRWPTVEGEIVRADVVQLGMDARGLQERVTYRYSVNGKSFVNDRVRIGPQPQRNSIVPATHYPVAADNVARRYPVGQRVTIRYNPKRPQESVLHAQPNLGLVLITLSAVVSLYWEARRLYRPH